MKDFRRWLNESVLPTIRQALEILEDREDRQDLVNHIQKADPYDDKRFAPIIAGWVRDLDIKPEEHAGDVAFFKSLHRRLKDLRVPATNREHTALVKSLLSKKPHDFIAHYSQLQDWNRQASDLLDPIKNLSDEGLPVEMRHNGYTMYRIDTKEHCRVPLVRNSMSWCVTKDSFGAYKGPPYYPIVRDSDKKPFAMIIPSYFDRDPSQAVRNASNNGRLSPADLKLVSPLVQHALPLDKHVNLYILGVHGVTPKLMSKPFANDALRIIVNYALEPGEWPEGERSISKSAKEAYLYAREVIKGAWPAGEEAISQDPEHACLYAINVLKGRFKRGEGSISQDAKEAYYYAHEVIKGPWPDGERAISQNGKWALLYAQNILVGPFPLGEEAINREPYYKGLYEKFLTILRGPYAGK